MENLNQPTPATPAAQTPTPVPGNNPASRKKLYIALAAFLVVIAGGIYYFTTSSSDEVVVEDIPSLNSSTSNLQGKIGINKGMKGLANVENEDLFKKDHTDGVKLQFSDENRGLYYISPTVDTTYGQLAKRSSKPWDFFFANWNPEKKKWKSTPQENIFDTANMDTFGPSELENVQLKAGDMVAVLSPVDSVYVANAVDGRTFIPNAYDLCTRVQGQGWHGFSLYTSDIAKAIANCKDYIVEAHVQISLKTSSGKVSDLFEKVNLSNSQTAKYSMIWLYFSGKPEVKKEVKHEDPKAENEIRAKATGGEKKIELEFDTPLASSKISQYTIEYQKDGDHTFTGFKTKIGYAYIYQTLKSKLVIESLSDDTKYNIHIIAYDNEGTKLSEKTISATTNKSEVKKTDETSLAITPGAKMPSASTITHGQTGVIFADFKLMSDKDVKIDKLTISRTGTGSIKDFAKVSVNFNGVTENLTFDAAGKASISSLNLTANSAVNITVKADMAATGGEGVTHKFSITAVTFKEGEKATAKFDTAVGPFFTLVKDPNAGKNETADVTVKLLDLQKATTVYQNSKNIIFTFNDFKTTKDGAIKEIVVTRKGTGTIADFADLSINYNGKKVTTGKLQADNTAKFTFDSLTLVGGKQNTIQVIADISGEAKIGNINQLGITSITFGDGSTKTYTDLFSKDVTIADDPSVSEFSFAATGDKNKINIAIKDPGSHSSIEYFKVYYYEETGAPLVDTKLYKIPTISDAEGFNPISKLSFSIDGLKDGAKYVVKILIYDKNKKELGSKFGEATTSAADPVVIKPSVSVAFSNAAVAYKAGEKKVVLGEFNITATEQASLTKIILTHRKTSDGSFSDISNVTLKIGSDSYNGATNIDKSTFEFNPPLVLPKNIKKSFTVYTDIAANAIVSSKHSLSIMSVNDLVFSEEATLTSQLPLLSEPITIDPAEIDLTQLTFPKPIFLHDPEKTYGKFFVNEGKGLIHLEWLKPKDAKMDVLTGYDLIYYKYDTPDKVTKIPSGTITENALSHEIADNTLIAGQTYVVELTAKYKNLPANTDTTVSKEIRILGF